MFYNLKKILDYSEKIGIPTMDVVVYKDGKQVFREARGFSDEKGSPVKEDLLFNIYSCSKFVTVVAALRLLEQKKFSLNDEVAEYIPAFGDVKVLKNGGLYKAENKIRVENLFTMTSGLTYGWGRAEIKQGVIETEGKTPTVKMMEYIAKMPLEYEPGETWNYGLSHDVLAALVEIISGKSFGEYVREQIVTPLGMNDFTFNLPDEELCRVCKQFSYENGKYVDVGRKIVCYKFGTEYESGGAGGVCTVNDYIKFLEGIRTGKILSEATRAIMIKDWLKDSQRKTYWAAKGYGYGLGIRVPDVTNRRTDIGWGGAAGAFLAIDLKNNISVYYAQHVLNSINKDVRKDIIEAVKLDLGLPAFEEDMWKGEGSYLA